MRDERLFSGTMINHFWTKAHLPGHRRPWRRLAACLAALGLLLALLSPAAAGDGALDPSFNHFMGVSKIPIIRGQDNWTSGGYAGGNSLIYGYFTSITDSNGTHSINSIAKLTNFNGTVDTNFQNSSNPHPWTINGEVRGVYMSNPAASPNSTQDIIIWGTFSLTSGSTTYYNLARLTWNTTDNAYVVDTTFPQIFSLVDNGAGTMVSGVNAVAVTGGYLSSYVLVGGYNLQVQGDTTHACHLIRLNNNFTYNSSYGPTNAYTQAKSLPGGYVTGIGLNSSNQPRIYGTLPVSNGSGGWNGTFHWWEAFSDTVTFQKSLGDQATSGSNYGPIDGPIFNLAQTSGGQYIITGTFKNVFGTALNRVAQLNSSLSGLDNTYNFNSNIATLGGADHGVQQIIIQGTGQPVLAGGFNSFNGTTCGHIVRLNYSGTIGGTVDTSFLSTGSSTAGADDRIFKLFNFQTSSTESYFQILGAFQNYNSTGRSCIATLNPPDGSLIGYYPSPFAAISANGGTVYAMDTVGFNNGTNWQNYIVIGGDFTGVNGKYRQNLAYLNLNGTLATGYPVTLFEGQVNAIRGLDNGTVLVAGNFLQSQGYGCTSLVRLNSNGAFDTTFRPIVAKGNGLAAGLRLVDTEDNGNVDIGGNFATVYDSSHNPQSRTAFARLSSDGTLDPSFNAQISIQGGDQIKVNTGGSFENGYAMVGYVRYHDNSYHDYGFGCTLDQSGNQLSSMLFNGEVLCGTGHGGKTGGVVVGGNFTQVLSPVSANRGHIAALTSNFTLDTSSFAGAGANGSIYALTSNGQNDSGKPLIGGSFTTYNGVGRNNVARLNLNGSLDTTFNPGAGANGPVYAIRWFNYGNNGPTIGKALFGGAFTKYNGTTMPGVAQVFAGMGASPAASILLLLGD